MAALDWIIARIWSIYFFFNNAYVEVSSWVWPFRYLAYPFQGIASVIHTMLFDLYDFKAWLYWISGWINKILDWDTIWNLIAPYFQWGINAWNWVVNAFTNVWNIVTDWWNTVYPVVLGWIDTAKQFAVSLFNQVSVWLGSLQAQWSSFLTSILPTLANWTGIANLIDTTLKRWFPWYDALALTIGGILTFFADPAKAVYELFDYVIDRFWEDS